MTAPNVDLKALADAFDQFTRSTQTMEEAYRRLEARIQELDRELAAKNRALELTRDYLDSVLESMTDGVIAVDVEGVITTFNKAASAVLGYSADEATGRRFQDVFGREHTIPPGAQAMELRAKSGESIPVSERDSPLADRSGRRIGFVKVFQDLREIEALREQVRRKDRLAALGEMAATVAHEIRNPLGGIRGFAALLERDVRGEDARARLVQKILKGTAELDRIVTELLEYTRPLQLRLRPVDCAGLVDAALSLLDAGDAPVAVTREIPAHLRMLADPDKMRQVILNILLNAVQSIDGEGEVRVRAEAEGGAVVVAVLDTGCGMTDAQLRKVFYPFYTTKEKGTGLGLAVAAKIVEGHGGHIEAHSVPGSGSRFVLRLPAAD